MPLTLNVGLSRKVGEANYGSRGASVNLELELDSAIVGESARLKDHIREVFRLAKSAVDEELQTPTESPPAANGNGQPHQSNGRNGSGRGGYQRTAGRFNHPPPATASQVRALHAIANQQRLDLIALLRERFELDQPEKLTIVEASDLIDELKGTAATSGGRR